MKYPAEAYLALPSTCQSEKIVCWIQSLDSLKMEEVSAIFELWFQQDSATCHTARATIDLLKETFGDRLISRFGPVNWPRTSCDLTPLDYFLWDYVKALVYADKPQTFDHLEDNIRRVIADIRPQMLEKVIENWMFRLDYIRASRGSPMPEIIFKIQVVEIVNGVYGADIVTASYEQFWFRRFRSGIFDGKDAPHTNKPIVENINKITKIIEVDRHVSSRSTAQKLNIDHKTVLSQLRKVGFKNKLHVWVPHQLRTVLNVTTKNMMDRISICEALAKQNKIDPFLKRMVTGDEKWVTYDNIVRKRSWS
ncbi:histone-lysine N-methyltransferase SETMAR [Trichonephila clavipes]|nr:histone-lysine N-methyltransferase SETMAR [Trichonephila clavipes]